MGKQCNDQELTPGTILLVKSRMKSDLPPGQYQALIRALGKAAPSAKV